jgi:hypothetical protein
VRVLDELARLAEDTLPLDTAVLVTISAPIRLPGKTISALARKFSDFLPSDIDGVDVCSSLCGNYVRLRLVKLLLPEAHRFLGFVHNSDGDSAQLLNMAEKWLSLAARHQDVVASTS